MEVHYHPPVQKNKSKNTFWILNDKFELERWQLNFNIRIKRETGYLFIYFKTFDKKPKQWN